MGLIRKDFLASVEANHQKHYSKEHNGVDLESEGYINLDDTLNHAKEEGETAEDNQAAATLILDYSTLLSEGSDHGHFIDCNLRADI